MEDNHKWQNYVMDKLTLDQIRKEGKLKIPDFQRGVVWTKQHRKEFIETVKSGDPFGVVLVSQDDKTGQYILIDGLQRLSTLRAYMEKPIDFVDENDKFVDQESLRNVFVKKYDFIKKSLPQEARLKKEAKLFLKKMIAFLKGQKVMPEADDVWQNIYPALDTKNKEISGHKDNAWLNKFNKHAHKWYLYQLLSAYWNKHRQTSDLKSLLDKVMDSDMFVINIDAGQWKNVYDEYCKGQHETAVGRSIPSESKLFLNYLYRLLINEDKNRENYFLARKDGRFSISFDIEHITPYAKFDGKDKDVPASALGNLCYLPAKDNRSKGEATLYEYSGDRPSLMLKPDFQELIDYPSQEDLDFVEASKETFRTRYNQLLDAREQKLYDKFIKLIIR